MSDDTLGLSIDLAAELVSITERQHLNQVHWAVQLVRHALEHRPHHVDVRLRRRVLELSHDGDALSPDEHALLFAVSAGPEEQRHAALVELEARFGVTLLTLLLTSPRAEVIGRRSLVAEGGRVRPGPPVARSGYLVRVWRRSGSAREEKAELRFYCRHAAVPIHVNGRPLNRPLLLEHALLTRAFRADDGAGLVGLPARGALARLRYYKRGVYFGVRKSLPRDGRPVEACFDAAVDDHEDNFERSVKSANLAVRAARRSLYDDLPARFATMTERERARVRDLALAADRERLPAALREPPLFRTSTSAWRLSFDDLARLARQYRYVPFLHRSDGRDDELPVLTPAEATAVSRLLDVPVRRALVFRPGRVARVKRWLSRLLPRS